MYARAETFSNYKRRHSRAARRRLFLKQEYSSLSAPGHNEEAGGTVGGRDNGGRYEEINPPRHNHPRLTPSAGHAGNPLDLPFPWRPPCPTNPRRLGPMRVVVVVASLLSYYELPHPDGRVGKPLSLSFSFYVSVLSLTLSFFSFFVAPFNEQDLLSERTFNDNGVSRKQKTLKTDALI